MYVRPMHHSGQLGRWLAILALAAILSLLFATAVGAADLSNRKPALLPAEIHHWAQPMEVPVGAGVRADSGLAESVWRVLELHRTRKHEAAVAAWNELTLPAGMEVWRQLGLGQALLALDRFDDSEQALRQALTLRSDYGIGHYFLGVLRLQQSYLADEWLDASPARGTRLVSTTWRPTLPRTKAQYEFEATAAFEAALAARATVCRDELLVPAELVGATALEPTVEDLLGALGADLWPGKAHNALSYLYLERGELEVAEGHMDRAVAEGMIAVYGYRDLGREYEAQGRHADAARAYFKGARFSSDKLRTTLDAVRNLGDAILSP